MVVTKQDYQNLKIKEGFFNLTTEEIEPSKDYIGLSLSACIEAVIRGRIDESHLVKIIAGVCCRNKEELQIVIRDYQRVYWRDIEQQAEELVWRLYNAGKIEQPRLKDGLAPDRCYGTWIEPIHEKDIKYR